MRSIHPSTSPKSSAELSAHTEGPLWPVRLRRSVRSEPTAGFPTEQTPMWSLRGESRVNVDKCFMEMCVLLIFTWEWCHHLIEGFHWLRLCGLCKNMMSQVSDVSLLSNRLPYSVKITFCCLCGILQKHGDNFRRGWGGFFVSRRHRRTVWGVSPVVCGCC